MSTWRNNIGILLLVGTRFGTLCSVGTIDAYWEYEIWRMVSVTGDFDADL